MVQIVQCRSHRLIWIGYWSSYGHFWRAESMSAFNGSRTLCWLWSWHTIVQQRYRPPVLHQMLFFYESVSTEGSHPYLVWYQERAHDPSIISTWYQQVGPARGSWPTRPSQALSRPYLISSILGLFMTVLWPFLFGGHIHHTFCRPYYPTI